MQSAWEEKRTNRKSAAAGRFELVLSRQVQLTSGNGFQRTLAFGIVRREEECSLQMTWQHRQNSDHCSAVRCEGLQGSKLIGSSPLKNDAIAKAVRSAPRALE